MIDKSIAYAAAELPNILPHGIEVVQGSSGFRDDLVVRIADKYGLVTVKLKDPDNVPSKIRLHHNPLAAKGSRGVWLTFNRKAIVGKDVTFSVDVTSA